MKKIIYVKSIAIGSGNIVLQSMTNTKTKDVEKTVKQINELFSYGAEIVRVAIKDEKDALALKEITKKALCPIVADIHFDYKLALLAIENGAAKIRINPGNMPSEHLKAIVEKCQAYHIPIRIGVNSGSLSDDIVKEYGVTPIALVNEAKREIERLENLGFTDIIISLKATDIDTFIEANILAYETFNYPLHIGLTEAGTLIKGSVRSTYAITKLLEKGIGDTIRVSLTADPINEIIAGKEILKIFKKAQGIELISCPTCGRTEYDMNNIIKRLEPMIDKINTNLKIAIMGCIVNGIGEGREADLGIAGGKNKAVIFKKGEILKTVSYEEIIPTFMEELNSLIKDEIA